MYAAIYNFLITYTPIILQRPFLFSSIYPVILVPTFILLEKYFPAAFVQRTKFAIIPSKPTDNLYHLFTMAVLAGCSLFDPYNLSFSLAALPKDPPPFINFLIWTSFLVMFHELVLSLLHILFHYNEFLYKYIHYVHHMDRDPTALSTTKLHIEEVLIVYLVMYLIPVIVFNPHHYCLLTAFMVASVLGTFAHSGIKNWHLADYHRQHHLNKRYNMWTPILSYFFTIEY